MKTLVAKISSTRFTLYCLIAALWLVFYASIWQPAIGVSESTERFFYAFFIYWSPEDSKIAIPYFPGGYTIGIALFLNLLLGRLSAKQLTIRNIGINITHVGIAILIVSQFYHRSAETVSYLTLGEGETANYAEDQSEFEVAIIEHTYSNFEDRVFAAPSKMLENQQLIRHESLPFTAAPHFYYKNSTRFPRSNDYSHNLIQATEGQGKTIQAIEIDPTPSASESNRPAALLTLYNQEEAIGTWLLQDGLPRQFLEVEGRRFSLELRPQHHYLPFGVSLNKVERSFYYGTDIEKSSNSQIAIRNEALGEQAELAMRTGQPYSYGEYTIYHYKNSTEDRSATLKLVQSSGDQLPYISLILIICGLVYHFGRSFVIFLKQEERAA